MGYDPGKVEHYAEKNFMPVMFLSLADLKSVLSGIAPYGLIINCAISCKPDIFLGRTSQLSFCIDCCQTLTEGVSLQGDHKHGGNPITVCHYKLVALSSNITQ